MAASQTLALVSPRGRAKKSAKSVSAGMALAAASAMAVSSMSATAATLYWDGGSADLVTPGNGASAGTSGTWDVSLTNWDDGTSHVAWANGSNTAVFGGTAGTVTVSAAISLTSGALQFNTTAYVLSTSSGSLSFSSGDNTIALNNVAAATINGAVGGSGNLTLTALYPSTAGTVTFNGTSTGGWSGATRIGQNMTMALAGLNQALLNTSAITLNGGGLTLTNTTAGEAALSRVSDTAAITSNGGTITFTNTSGTTVYAETIGSIALTSGQLNIVETTNQAGAGSQTLTLAGLTRPGATAAVTFSSASGLNVTKNMIVVAGATATAADEIIGSWATVGTTAALQTDYAVYNGAAQVVARNIAATAESTWSTVAASTSNYTANAGTGAISLTGTRNVNTLRSLSAANSVMADNTTDVINFATNTFADGDAVVLGGTTMPTGLTAGTPYFVVNRTASNFQVSATSGGSPILFTTNGSAINATGAVLVSSGNNLGTTGILNGVASTMAIVATGTGVVTLPTTTSGHLNVNAGSGPITIAAPIADNGAGVLTLVKNGSSTLTLSGSSSYTGGTVINAGTLATTADANLGSTVSPGGVTFSGNATWNLGGGSIVTYDRSLTINDGAIANLASGNAVKIITGVVSGNGILVWSATTGLQLSNANNTFNGPILITTGGTNPYGFEPTSLGDDAGAGTVSLGGASTTGYFYWRGGSKTFDDRQFVLSGTGTGGGVISNLGSGALTITRDLLVAAVTNKTLTLAGTNADGNVFAGNIADGTGSVISLTKNGTIGTWALSGTNTYSGATTLDKTGTSGTTSGYLIFQGMQAVSPNTSLNQTHGGGSGGHGTWKFLDDSATPASRSTVNLNHRQDNASQNSMSVFVGNNSTANGGTSNSTQTGSTIQLGNMNFTQGVAGATAGAALVVTGANDYKLQLANVNVSLQAAYAGNWNVKLSGGAPLIVTGKVQQTGGTAASTTTLQLDGAATANEISGTIEDSADARVMKLTKLGGGTWRLSGINTYTGATSIAAGTLLVNGNSSAATGAVDVASTGTLGGSGTIGGNAAFASGSTLAAGNNGVGTLTFNQNLSLAGGADAAGANAVFEGGDLVDVNGSLTLADGWNLKLSTGFSDGGTVTLFTYTTGLIDLDANIDVSGLGFTPSGALSLADTGSSIVLTGISVVPEPSSLALLALGAAGLLARRRRSVKAQ